MVKLMIINKNEYLYSLKDERNNDYELNLEFLDVEEKPQIGDYICMSAELLNTRYAGYSTNYTFGKMDSKYGRENLSLTDIDVIKIENTDKEIYLKRLYG